MTITTLILLLATGIVAATLVHGRQVLKINNSCCHLGYNHFTFSRSTPSGVYTIQNYCDNNPLEAEAYCDNSNAGGGWLVVHRRRDGSVSFDRTWVEYEDGLGSLTGNFWYGLRALHCLTGQGGWEMRVDVQLKDGTNFFLQYE